MVDVDPRIFQKYMEYREEESNIIRFQLETREQLEAFKYDLLGFEYNETEKRYMKSETRDALCNEKGANAIVGLLKPDVSKIVSLSNLGDEEIDRMGLEDLNEFTYYLVRHKDEYEFKSLQAISVILGRINKLNYSTMKKAREAGERDTIRKNYTISQSDSKVIQEQPKGSIFNMGGLIK